MLLKRLGYLLSLLLFFSLGYFFSQQRLFWSVSGPALPESPPAELDFALFDKTYALLKKHYLRAGELKSDKLVQGAIRGMLASLGDPYTSFFDQSQNREFKKDLAGVYEGIGAQLGFKDHKLVIVAPLVDSPAQKAGVRAGDRILAVDEKSTDGMSLPEAVDLIRGQAGSSVVLTLARMGQEQTLRKKIIRGRITVASVLVTKVGENQQIARLQILRFGDDTQRTWDEVVSKLKQKRPEGIILDLRNNPGGYLNAAIYLASEFLGDGVVVIKQEAGDRRQEFRVDHEARLAGIPVVVLVNEGSASASEILAGALKVRGRAQLVGQKTFGKGTVQEAFELSGGAGVHITTAQWLLPDGKNINGEGIAPDVKVQNTEETLKNGQDLQLDKAIEMLQDDGR